MLKKGAKNKQKSRLIQAKPYSLMMLGEQALRKNVCIKIAILRKKSMLMPLEKTTLSFELISNRSDASVAPLFIGLQEVELSENKRRLLR